MTTKTRSDKQERILTYIREFLAEHDYPPSIRDIQAGCEISSTSVVDYNLRALEAKGMIRRDREVSRGIQLREGSGRSGAIIEVPLLGTIAAGKPLSLPTEEGVDPQRAAEFIPVPREMLRGRENVYALKVKGTSMMDALINDGDIVLLEPAVRVNDGEMAAVRLKSENEVTFKRFHREGKRVRLQPENKTMQPIYAAAGEVEVQGKFLGVIRSA